MNSSNTNVMAAARENGRKAKSVSVDVSTLEKVDKFKDLGARIQSDDDVSKEIKS